MDAREKKNELLRYLGTTLSNIGVIGVGLSMWQDGSVWAFIGGTCSIAFGCVLIKRVQ